MSAFDRIFRPGQGWRTEAESGGSQPYKTLNQTYAWDEPGLAAISLPIVAVDQGQKTFTVDGDQTARITDFIYISGSTGNDGVYSVDSVTLDGGDTVITVLEAIPDATVDGIIGGGGGIEVGFTPSDGDVLVFCGIFLMEAFDGDNPTVELGWPDDVGGLAEISATGGNVDNVQDAHLRYTVMNGGGLWPNSSIHVYRFTDSEPVKLVVTNGSFADPGSTQGRVRVCLIALKADA